MNITKELVDIRVKTLIHLQCNIGFDTISLARYGLKKVTGVDLSDQNIRFANKLKKRLGMDHIEYMNSNVSRLMRHIMTNTISFFTSEGVLGWLPDLTQWAK
jgi:2-polyprenyl-3-methyl-5-hydroxy-6-metoxy-1,4-benzoquinol methylase